MADQRQPYYVSVQAGTVHPDRAGSSHEFEIRATAREAYDLQCWMDQRSTLDGINWVRAMTPGIPYHQDTENDQLDAHLTTTYQKIAQLGTPETKQHLARMGYR